MLLAVEENVSKMPEAYFLILAGAIALLVLLVILITIVKIRQRHLEEDPEYYDYELDIFLAIIGFVVSAIKFLFKRKTAKAVSGHSSDLPSTVNNSLVGLSYSDNSKKFSLFSFNFNVNFNFSRKEKKKKRK